jgi:hypothetical protein
METLTIKHNIFPEYFGFLSSVIILPMPHFHSSIIRRMEVNQIETAVTWRLNRKAAVILDKHEPKLLIN